jgi:hypothetical protein
MHTIETLAEDALLLANDEGQEQTEAELKQREAEYAERKAIVPKVTERRTMLQTRLAELNKAQPLQQATYKSQTAGLVDEFILGCPPLDDSAHKYAALDSVRRFLDLSIARVVEYHLPLAQREIIVAELDTAKARAALLDKRALLSMIKRHRLMKAVVEHERSVELSGGITEQILKVSQEAHMEILRLEDTLRTFDKQLHEMQVKLQLR